MVKVSKQEADRIRELLNEAEKESEVKNIPEQVTKDTVMGITSTDGYSCGNCGSAVSKGQKYCNSCGHEMDWGQLVQ